MSWFSSKPKKPTSAAGYPGDLTKLKNKQIEELLKYLPSATEYTSTAAGVTVYQMSVFTKFGPLKMHIIMPAQFPTEQPKLKVLTQVAHPWVDAEMNVMAPKVKEWGVHSNLGTTVQEVFHEFSRNPPSPVAVAQPLGGAGSQPPLPSRAQAQATPPPLPQQPPPPEEKEEEHAAFPLPAVPASFPELESLTLDELEKLVNDSDALNEIVENQSSSTSMMTIRNDLCDSVEQQAKKNLSKQGALEGYEAKVQVLLNEIKETKKIVDDLIARKKAIDGRYSIESVAQALAKKIDDFEDKSDELRDLYEDQDDDSDSSLDGSDEDDGKKKKKLTHKKFFSKYVDLRTKTHECMAKRERLVEVYR